jgi:hypothetical protein
MKLTQVKNKLTFEFPKPRTKRQLAIIDVMIKKNDRVNLINYLNTFTGMAAGGLARNTLRDYRRTHVQCGSLHQDSPMKRNRFLNLFKKQYDTSIQHSPTDNYKGDWIGVEIECCIPFDSLALESSECDYFCEECGETCCSCEHECNSNSNSRGNLKALSNYLTAAKIKNCSVKDDASISEDDGHFGAELTIVFRKNDRTPLLKLCKALNTLEARVNASCGMHVHLDQRHLRLASGAPSAALQRRANSLQCAVQFLSTLVPKSRSNNTYCKLTPGAWHGGRYHAVNLEAFGKYGTIEIRLHSATTDYTKITNWIDLLLLTQDASLEDVVTSLDHYCELVTVPERLISYMEERITKFNPVVDTSTYTASPVEASPSPAVEEEQTTLQQGVVFGEIVVPQMEVFTAFSSMLRTGTED